MYYKHGMHGTPTQRCWIAMRYRCFNKDSKYYKHYGGRGITICERWSDFKNFLADMGEKPEGMTLDRIDNNGDYSPENCRWSTPAQQGRNRRTNRLNQEKADDIRKLYATGTISQREIGLRYGIEQNHISRVINNKIWS